ncbi:MAG: PQQ-binding-like beta-propeller repeat protein [Dehalococcoidia bacterium]
MRQAKIAFLVMLLLLAAVFVSCISGGGQAPGGWAGTVWHGGMLYAGSGDGRVVAINASSGEVQWSYSVAVAQSSGTISCGQSVGFAAVYTTPVVYGDLVYVGTYSGQVYALTRDRGTERWVYPRTGSIGAIVGSPVVGNQTMYVSSSDGMVYALDTSYGDLNWKSQPVADKLWTSPTLVGNTVYVSTFEGHIYALSAKSGELEWSFEGETGFASSPVLYQDVIYAGSFDNKLYAIRVADSESLWELSGGKWFWATPVVSEGVVYAGCLDGRLYAVSAETGQKVWEFDAGNRVVSSPVLTDDWLIMVDEPGTVYVFDLEGGLTDQGVPWRIIPTDAGVRSAFCAHEGQVYIRGEDGLLYVVDIQMGEVIDLVSLAVEN